MEILAFQTFIGVTIILTGLIAKKHLATICLAWTAFTFLAVFAAPLLILQLVTIWGCFALFNSGETSQKGTTSIPSREMPDGGATPARSETVKAQGNANKPALLERAVHATHQVAKALDDLDDYVTLQKEVQRATSELDLAIRAERALIEAILKSSKLTVDVEKKLEADPVLRKYYDESKHKFDEIERKLHSEFKGIEGGKGTTLSVPALPVFDFPPRHSNPKIADAIENKISSFKNGRDLFLSGIVKEIRADDKLQKKFEENLSQRGAFEIYTRLCLKGEKSAPQQIAAPATPKPAAAPRPTSQGHPQHSGASNTPRSGSMVLQTLSQQERDARLNALADARRRDEEERRRQAEESARRAEREAAEARQRGEVATRNHGSQTAKATTDSAVLRDAVTRLNSLGIKGTLSSAVDLPNTYVAPAIKAHAEALKIPFLIHFTQAANLRSIMEHGLCSLIALRETGIRPHVNDHQRYDGHPDAICLSIAHPNDKMLFKYQKSNPDQDWAVLVLDVSILWTHNIAFCKHNAADHRMRTRPLAQRNEASAFEAMFLPADDSPSRGEQNLEPFDPTDVQAELLVFDRLQPELINSVVFSSSRAAERYKDWLRGKPTAIDDGRGFFAARSYVRKSGWTYSAAASPRPVKWQQSARVEESLSALERGKIKLTDIPF